MKTTFKLLHLLADGKFHSGEELGAKLGMTRAGIWKALKQVEEFHLPLHSVKGKGYQIPGGLELFQNEPIMDQLSHVAKTYLSRLEIVNSLDSTNQFLLDHIKQTPNGNGNNIFHGDNGLTNGIALLAEQQIAGRGRRGRQWISPFGSNIYLSLLWRFDRDPTQLGGLSLVVATVITQALKRYGLIDGIGVKWPNDVCWNLKKLGGTLIEMVAETYGSTYVVIGIGLNLAMPPIAAESIEQEWIDLQQITGQRPARNQLAGLLLDELITTLVDFEKEGPKAYLNAWQELDFMRNKSIYLKTDSEQIAGIARGIGEHGELLLEDEFGTRKSFFIGDVSLRLRK